MLEVEEAGFIALSETHGQEHSPLQPSNKSGSVQQESHLQMKNKNLKQLIITIKKQWLNSAAERSSKPYETGKSRSRLLLRQETEHS